MKQQILNEVEDSTWQPEFEFTDDLDIAVDSILKPHEDYFLKLHDRVKEIIQRESEYAKHIIDTRKYQQHNIDSSDMKHFTKAIDNYQITFADVCNWQKELFECKKEKIKDFVKPDWQFDEYHDSDDPDEIREWKDAAFRWNHCKKIISVLPNQHINLGLRQINVKVGDWTPPNPVFLEELKEMCFPIGVDIIKNNSIKWLETQQIGLVPNTDIIDYEELYLSEIIEWYKVFETIHFFEDLNGRIGGIVINILSYCLTGKYLKHV